MKKNNKQRNKISMKPRKKARSICHRCVHKCEMWLQAKENGLRVRKCRDFLDESKVYETNGRN